MNRWVMLLNDLHAFIMNIPRNNNLLPRMFLRQRKHFRNRQGFENAMAGQHKFIGKGMWGAGCEEDKGGHEEAAIA
jgi:hypothetical protein